MATAKLRLNGNEVEFTPGDTILQVAWRNGVKVPTLCYLKDCTPTGACRMCLVEVTGARTLVASCAMPAAEGMEVFTDTEKVHRARRLAIELLLSSGEHNCLLCEANGECKLQEYAYEYGVSAGRFEGATQKYPIEDSNPLIIRDFSKCILCGRCVQACNEVQVNRAIGFGYRGAEAKIITTGDRPYDQSDCVFCGQCVEVCPTGALTEKKAKGLGRPWETKKIRTTCPYCGVGCQMWLHVKGNRVIKVTAVEEAQPNRGRLCVKGRFGYDFIHSPERLTSPLIKQADGSFAEASWDEALDLVAAKFKEILASDGPQALGGFSSARVSNEENYLFQKLVRAVLGTNNLDHCARLCHSSTVAGLAAAFGSGAMTNSIAEIPDCPVMLVIGSNTTETHPVIGTFVKQAVLNNNARVIVADPRRIPLVRDAALWLRQRPGTDLALINGLIHVILRDGLEDQEYIQSRTDGFPALKESVAKYDPGAVEAITGIPAADIETAARMFADAERAAIFYAMGITQHTVGTDNVKAVANLAMVTGNVGKQAAGVNPLRGQNNVQGACDMGALPGDFPAYQKVADPKVRAKFVQAWGLESISEAPGLTVTEMVDAAAEGKLKGLLIMGENSLVSDPDLNHLRKALAALEFLVVQDIFLTETAQMADVVLPSACWAEKDGTFTNTERRVQRIRQAVLAPGQAWPDWKILQELAKRLGHVWDYQGPAEIMEEISTVTPSYAGINYKRLETLGGLHWPCPTTEHGGTCVLHVDGFARGKGLFHAVEHREPNELPDEDYPFTLTTGRNLYQYHTGSMTRRSAGVNDLAPECLVEISEADAKDLGLATGDRVKVSSRRGSLQAKAWVTDNVGSKVIFIPFHYSEAAANELTNPALDPVSKIPEYKVCAVKVEKAA